tara:strand:- start:13387 stop:14385 length:999 start_codon:yes stop_codon:yes gene_type:complete
MPLRLCSYNLEWFDDHFDHHNAMLTDAESVARLEAAAYVMKTIDADMTGIVEGPGTTASTGKSTVACLENFAAHFGLRQSKALMGFPSNGRQEIALLYDPSKVSAAHDPGGKASSRNNPPFDKPFEFDSDEDGVREIYSHYRPPLEAKVTRLDTGASFQLAVVHAKSKGIFSKNDLIHYQREEMRNRRKLFAECSHIRMRIDDWLDTGRSVVVMGDINDGPGMDAVEFRFARSAVETVMGDVFEPEKIVKSWGGKPEWGEFGFEPSSARFTDRFTEDPVNVLIDHVLASLDLKVAGPDAHRVWNPYQLDAAKPHKKMLLAASDHFPVTLDLA